MMSDMCVLIVLHAFNWLPCQNAELSCHEPEAGPGEQVGSLCSVADDLLPLVLQRLQLSLQLLQLLHQLLLPDT